MQNRYKTFDRLFVREATFRMALIARKHHFNNRSVVVLTQPKLVKVMEQRVRMPQITQDLLYKKSMRHSGEKIQLISPGPDVAYTKERV
jgi:hypothetical protein